MEAEQAGVVRSMILSVRGKTFSCECGCNVFNKPDPKRRELYECNSCANHFDATPLTATQNLTQLLKQNYQNVAHHGNLTRPPYYATTEYDI